MPDTLLPPTPPPPSPTLCPVAQMLVEPGPLLRGGEGLQRQLLLRLQDGILAGRLLPGSRLPGSRGLAEALSLSRNTVNAVYEHLAAEGYVHSDRQGTRVAALSRPAGRTGPTPAQAVPAPALARRLDGIQATVSGVDASTTLRPGMPALSQFPLAAWRRTMDKAVSRAGPAALWYGDPAGEPALRTAVAQYLAVARGVRCTPEQIVITEGTQEALALCVRLLSNPGDTAWVEDPGYRGAKVAMQAGDLHTLPMPVDADGLRTTPQDWKSHTPKLVYTTPSHQFPIGAVLTVARRLELIAQARRYGAWIIEDDYDSEFRHNGEPIAAMQGLVAQAPVVYVGSFSKTMFPSMRLGFLVLPEVLASAVQAPLAELLRGGHRYEQLALADFLHSGQFSRHLGRMRRLYRERQRALREALTQHLPVPHQIEGGHCGMHLLLRLPTRYPDQAIAQAARRYGMAPLALSALAVQPRADDNGLVLGYGSSSTDVFAGLVRRLSTLVVDSARG